MRAAEVNAEADRVEEAQARADHETAGDRDVFSILEHPVATENVSAVQRTAPTRSRPSIYIPRTCALLLVQAAVVVVSAEAGNIGIIQSANAAASKLFGYARSELEFRSINMLMPGPIGRMHDSFMRRYMRAGDGQIVDYTRVLLGMHRSGAIFPLKVSVRESSAMEDATTGGASFVAVMQAYAMESEVLLLDAHDGIIAASAASLTMLGVDGAALVARRAAVPAGAAAATLEASGPGGATAKHGHADVPNHMSEWVREWAAELPRLRAGGEVSLLVDPALHARGGQQPSSARSPGVNTPRPGVVPSGPLPPSTWILARMNTFPLGETGALRVSVVYWTRLANDAATVAQAVSQRRASLAALASNATQVLSPVAATTSDSPMTTRALARGAAAASGTGSARAAGGCPFMVPTDSERAHHVSTPKIRRPASDDALFSLVHGGAGDAGTGDGESGRLPGTTDEVPAQRAPATLLPLPDSTTQGGAGGAGGGGRAANRRISFAVESPPDGACTPAAAPIASATLTPRAKFGIDVTVVGNHNYRTASGSGDSSARGAADDSSDDADDSGGNAGKAGGRDDLRASVRGSGSIASSHRTSAHRARDRLRHIVLGGGTLTILPGLRTLRVVAIVTVTACVLLAIATTGFEWTVQVRLRDELQTALTTPDIIHAVGAMTTPARALLLQSNGWVRPQATANLAATRAVLVAATDSFNALVSTAFAAASSFGDGTHFLDRGTLFTLPSGATETLSLLECDTHIQAAAYLVAAMPVANISGSPAVAVRRRAMS